MEAPLRSRPAEAIDADIQKARIFYLAPRLTDPRAAAPFFMFSAEDVDASLFVDEPEGRDGNEAEGTEAEDDMLDDLIDGFCRDSLNPQPIALTPTVQLAQYDRSSADAAKRRRLGSGPASVPKSNITLTALWSEPSNVASEPAGTSDVTEEYQPPMRLPNVGSSQISEAQRAQIFPAEEDLRAIARWIIEDDHIAVCCACLEDLWTDEDADAVPAELLSRFASYLTEEKNADARRIALISSCHHMFHEKCIDKWAETENACCQCKQRFGLMAIYTESGHRVDIRAVKKRLQSHTIREEQLNDTAGHICYVCHQLGDRDSLMQCALCDVHSHWYCHQFEAMPSEPWHCVDHQSRGNRPSANGQDPVEARRASRTRTQARAPGRNRQTSRVTGNLPLTVTTRRGRGATTGNAVLREAINSLNQPEPSAAALADTWLPAHTMTDAFDIPFDPAATSYAEFHRPREREQQRLTKSSIDDLLSGEVTVAELMGKPTQDRSSEVTQGSQLAEQPNALGPFGAGSRMRGTDIVSRSNPAAEAAHEQNQQVLRRAEDHENRARQHREKEAEHNARATYYIRRRENTDLDRQSRREAHNKAREHTVKAQEHGSRAQEHEDRAKTLRQSDNSTHRTTARARRPPIPVPVRSAITTNDVTIPTGQRRDLPAPTRPPSQRSQQPKSSLEAALAGLQKFANKKSM